VNALRGRAYRRQQWRRAKARAVRFLRRLFAADPQWITPGRIAAYAVNRTPCSCPLCGNPRRFTGEVTRQEVQAECRCAD